MRKGTFFCFLFSSLLHAQKQNNIWYFGQGAGIDFNTNPPVALMDGALKSDEACANISDANGQILFYTDGETVYNKHHQVMENGSGLMGNRSSTQGAIIIPWPDNDKLFFIITSDAYENFAANGYNYSLVDINRNSGLGSVIEKNKLLYAISTEKLTVARHQNGKDWWVITKPWGNNQFYSYLIDKNGLNTTPVISVAGTILNGGFDKIVGCMEISPDNKKLAAVFAHYALIDDSYLELYDFNNVTGQITNSIKLEEHVPYGLAFSPDSKLLYVSNTAVNPTSYERKIDQLDISTATNATELEATRVTVTPSNYNRFPMGLQLGPDDKLYINTYNILTGETAIDAFYSPNSKWLGCDLHEDVIDLRGRESGIMFPNIINNSVAAPSPFNIDALFTVLDPCKREVALNAISNQTTNVSYRWDLDNGSVSSAEDINAIYPFSKEVFNVSLEVTADVPTGAGYQTQTKTVTKQLTFNPLPKANAGNDMIAIAGEPFHLTGSGGITYQWSPSQYLNHSTIADPIAALRKDQTFTLKVANADGCMDEDQVSVKVYKEATIYVPTGFTPNNDSKNDLLHVLPAGVKLESFSVYNRWGNRVFSTTDDTKGWNGLYKGKQQPEGTYVWIATGVDFKGQAVLRRGTVNLIR